MKPAEKNVARATGLVISAARKQRGFSQKDLASKLGTSQGTISKTEAGALMPSVHEWFEICKIVDIAPDCYVNGVIDLRKILKETESKKIEGFKVDSRYAVERGSSTRTVLPFIIGIEETIGAEKTDALFKELNVDRDYFVNMGHTVNLRFILDLMSMAKKVEASPKDSFAAFATPVAQEKFHGRFWSDYSRQNDALGMMKDLLSKATYYELNFAYAIEDLKNTSLDFSAVPLAHLKSKAIHLRPDEGKMLCVYKKNYFQSMASVKAGKKLKLKEHQCAFEGHDRCVYGLQFQ